MPQQPVGRGRLSREVVTRAALDLVDRQGAEALTMRRLAAELGVTPMALYNHVESRAALAAAVADLVAREMTAREAAARGWQERLRRSARAVRSAYLRHPRAVGLVQSATRASPALAAPADAVVGCLTEAGFADADARHGWAAVIGLVNGHVGYQLGGHLGAGDRGWDAAFEFALDVLVGGFEAHPARRR